MKLFKTIPEADVLVSGEIEIVRVGLADLTLVSGTPAPSPLPSSLADGAIALGDEAILLAGSHKGKVLKVVTIDDAGIWLKGTTKGFSPTVGPFQRDQIKKSSGRK